MVFKDSIFLFLVISIAYGQRVPEEFKELADMLHKTCVEESSVSEGAIADCNKGVFAEDQNLKCYMKCLMSQMATIDDDGIIDVEAVVSIIPDNLKALMEPIIRKCGTKPGADPCDNAFQTNKCYYAENPSVNQAKYFYKHYL